MKGLFGVMVLLAIPLSGCSFFVRTTLMPTIDTRGEGGVGAVATVGVGPTNKFRYERWTEEKTVDVMTMTLSGGAHASPTDGGGILSAVALEWEGVGKEPGILGYRATVANDAIAYPRNNAAYIGIGVGGGLPLTFARQGDVRFTIGPSANASFMPGYETSGGRLLLGGGVSFEIYKLTSWDIAM